LWDLFVDEEGEAFGQLGWVIVVLVGKNFAADGGGFGLC
jgi:hypothetical protein